MPGGSQTRNGQPPPPPPPPLPGPCRWFCEQLKKCVPSLRFLTTTAPSGQAGHALPTRSESPPERGQSAEQEKHRSSAGGAPLGSESAAVGGLAKHDGQMWWLVPVAVLVTLRVWKRQRGQRWWCEDRSPPPGRKWSSAQRLHRSTRTARAPPPPPPSAAPPPRCCCCCGRAFALGWQRICIGPPHLPHAGAESSTSRCTGHVPVSLRPKAAATAATSLETSRLALLYRGCIVRITCSTA